MSDVASEHRVVEAEPARPVDQPRADRRERARSSGYRKRFGAIYFALAIAAGAAVGSLVVLMMRPDPAPRQAWAQWEPTGSITERIYQITDQIPKRYRQDGNQLVSAALSSPQTTVVMPDGQPAVVPVQRIAVSHEGDISQVETSSGVQFTLSGSGPGGAVGGGTPSAARYSLLQRQALEIALYAFKYVDDLQSVTVLLPPSQSKGADPGAAQAPPQPNAVFLRRSDVTTALSQPLRATLKPDVPKVGMMPAVDRRSLNTFAIPNTFEFGYDQAQDGAFVMLLAPKGAGT